MNDAYDNAQTDREILRRITCDDDGHQHNCRHLETGVVHISGSVRVPAIEGHGYLEQEDQELADAAQVQATIRASMSDLEIVNEIIRVAGYDRIEIIADMLDDRFADYIDSEG